MEIKFKKCINCGEEKPFSDFYKNSTYTDGVANKCKKCVITYTKDRYRDNPEPTKIRVKKWQKEHPEETRIVRYRSQIKNKEHRKEYNAKYDQSHSEEKLARTRTRQARLLGAPGDGWSVSQRHDLIEEYDHRCAYCGKKFDKLELDHIVPITKGGIHSIENAVPACRTCNCSKSNKPLLIWMWQERKKYENKWAIGD